MATSSITAYRNCKITKDRNARVDQIEAYLSSIPASDKTE